MHENNDAHMKQIKQLSDQYTRILARESKVVDDSLSEYRNKLNLMRQVYSTLPATLPKPQTIPVIFNYKYDEVFLSKYLKFILDPQMNGLGIDPLKAFVIEYMTNVVDLDSDSTVEIELEHPTSNGRIDLLIVIDNSIVKALAISADGRHLYAASEGGGVFRLDLNGEPPAPALSPASSTQGDTVSVATAVSHPTVSSTAGPAPGSGSFPGLPCGSAAVLPMVIIGLSRFWHRRSM